MSGFDRTILLLVGHAHSCTSPSVIKKVGHSITIYYDWIPPTVFRQDLVPWCTPEISYTLGCMKIHPSCIVIQMHCHASLVTDWGKYYATQTLYCSGLTGSSHSPCAWQQIFVIFAIGMIQQPKRWKVG